MLSAMYLTNNQYIYKSATYHICLKLHGAQELITQNNGLLLISGTHFRLTVCTGVSLNKTLDLHPLLTSNTTQKCFINLSETQRVRREITPEIFIKLLVKMLATLGLYPSLLDHCFFIGKQVMLVTWMGNAIIFSHNQHIHNNLI